MERRLFLTGMLGVAGAAALASLAGPSKAIAGIPADNGILDELDKPDNAVFDRYGMESVAHQVDDLYEQILARRRAGRGRRRS